MKHLLIMSTLLTCNIITPSHSISMLPSILEDSMPNRSNSTTEDDNPIHSLQARVNELDQKLDLLFKENDKTTYQAWLKHTLNDLEETKADLKQTSNTLNERTMEFYKALYEKEEELCNAKSECDKIKVQLEFETCLTKLAIDQVNTEFKSEIDTASIQHNLEMCRTTSECDKVKAELESKIKELNSKIDTASIKHKLEMCRTTSECDKVKAELESKIKELNSKANEVSKITQELKAEKHGRRRYWADTKCFTLGASMATAGYAVFAYFCLPPGSNLNISMNFTKPNN